VLPSSTERSSSSVLGSDTAPPTSSSGAEVAGVQQSRPAALARTGIDAGVLLMIGGLLILTGVLTVRYAES